MPGTSIRLTFDGSDLRIHAGCNHLRGHARLDGRRLRVDSFGGTEMGCPQPLMQQDARLGRFFTSGPQVRLAGDTLVLTSGQSTIELVDRRIVDPDRPLRDTRWVVEGVIDGATVSSVPAGARAHVTFSEDERMRGNAGCNDFGARFTVHGSQIQITKQVTTLQSCGDAPDRLERAVLRVLDGPLTYEITADRLQLTAQPSGDGLALRAPEHEARFHGYDMTWARMTE
ncbi:MAG: META domain-containing protein [Pseudonocardiaceae bacterium]|nr:META domain-containing protein [Pseudonocardiaceae bacterium]